MNLNSSSIGSGPTSSPCFDQQIRKLSGMEIRKASLERMNRWLNDSNQLIPTGGGGGMALKSYLEKAEFVDEDPCTGKPLVYFNGTTPSELDRIVSEASKAQKQWMDVPVTERCKLLRKLAELIRSDSEYLSQLETLDTGKPYSQSLSDVLDCADTFDLFAGYMSTFHGTHVPVTPNASSFYYTRKEPLGVCAGIGAWNYPLQIAVWKSAPAIAAGNALVFKPSPFTPLSAFRLWELYAQAGFPSYLFSVVLGGIEVGQTLINHSLIAKVSFTGSVPGGQGVITTASKRIIPTTLELGGKSALIIMPDSDLNEAVKGTLMANFYNQGQVCSNAARVFVHKSIFTQFQTKLVDAVRKLLVGDPFDEQVSLGALINADQLAKVCDYIKSGLQEGASCLIGGDRPSLLEDYLMQGHYLTPCVLTNCHDNMRVVREEIFGPVVTLLEFESENEVIERANASEFGLCGGVFTKDLSVAHSMAAKLQCGSVYINTYNAYAPGIPFGGYKMSGLGRENCVETLSSYTQLKSVYVEGEKLPEPFP